MTARATGRAVADLPRDLVGLADEQPANGALDLVDEPLAAELDHVVAVRALVGDDVDDGDVALLRGPALDRGELGDHALERLELLRDHLVGHLDLALRHLELRPVGRLGLRLDGELGREAPALASRSWAARTGTRAARPAVRACAAAAVQNQLPMCDSTASE